MTTDSEAAVPSSELSSSTRSLRNRGNGDIGAKHASFGGPRMLPPPRRTLVGGHRWSQLEVGVLRLKRCRHTEYGSLQYTYMCVSPVRALSTLYSLYYNAPSTCVHYRLP